MKKLLGIFISISVFLIVSAACTVTTYAYSTNLIIVVEETADSTEITQSPAERKDSSTPQDSSEAAANKALSELEDSTSIKTGTVCFFVTGFAIIAVLVTLCVFAAEKFKNQKNQ